MAKPIFTILEGGSENPFQTVELDKESRKYIHVRVNNIVKTYDEDGEMNKTNNFFDLSKCQENFMSS